MLAPSCTASAAIVPKIATIVTANQQAGGRDSRWRSCSHSANHRPKIPIAPAIGTLFWPRKSDIASPMPVVNSFSTQKIAVISGTFVSARRAGEVVALASRRAASKPASGITPNQQQGGGGERHRGIAAEHG